MDRETSGWSFVVAGVLSQFGWFAAVLGAAYGFPWAGPLAALLIIPASGFLLKQPQRIARLSLACIAAGCLIETSLAGAGLVAYQEPGPLAPFPPLWLLALWALFAVVIETGLRPIERSVVVQCLVGALGGPLAYLAGESLGAMTFLDPRMQGLLALSLMWAVALPCLMTLRRALHAERRSVS